MPELLIQQKANKDQNPHLQKAQFVLAYLLASSQVYISKQWETGIKIFTVSRLEQWVSGVQDDIQAPKSKCRMTQFNQKLLHIQELSE